MSSAGKATKKQEVGDHGPGKAAIAPDRVTHMTVDAEYAGQRLDNFLMRLARGVPKSHVYRIVRSGEVRINRARASADQRVQAGDELRIPPMRTSVRPPTRVAPADMPPVLFEDEHLMALDKPPGLAAHGGSGIAFGLIERVRASTLDESAAELQLMTFLNPYIGAGKSPMCGNSICQDRRFLARWMPALEDYFHYRNLDVSTLKELARRWKPDLMKGVPKEGKHEALADVYESIAELKYYRQEFIRA